MLGDKAIIPLLEVGQEDVAHPKTIAACLVHVGRSDAAEGRADFVLAFVLLVGGIQQAVRGQNQVGLAGDE